MVWLTRRTVIAGGAALLASGGRVAQGQEGRFFRIATGPTDSSYFAVGALIGNLVSSPPGARECDRGGSCGVPGLIAVTQTTSGTVANIEAMQTRRAESALCQSDVADWALKGAGIFRQKAAPNLRVIAGLYREPMHLVVRRDSNIGELRQLRGKAVSLGERDSGPLATARAILQGMGFPERNLKPQFLTNADAVDALKSGKIDAFFCLTAMPSPLITELALTLDIALVPIAGPAAVKLLEVSPFYAEATIPSAIYPGVKETTTISVGVQWIVGAEVDDRLVQGLTRALWHPNNRRALDMGHPLGRQIRRDTALGGLTLQLHPGATAFYKEQGLLR